MLWFLFEFRYRQCITLFVLTTLACIFVSRGIGDLRSEDLLVGEQRSVDSGESDALVELAVIAQAIGKVNLVDEGDTEIELSDVLRRLVTVGRQKFVVRRVLAGTAAPEILVDHLVIAPDREIVGGVSTLRFRRGPQIVRAKSGWSVQCEATYLLLLRRSQNAVFTLAFGNDEPDKSVFLLIPAP